MAAWGRVIFDETVLMSTPMGEVELGMVSIGDRERLVPLDVGQFDEGFDPLDLVGDEHYCRLHDVFVGSVRSDRHYPCPWCEDGGRP